MTCREAPPLPGSQRVAHTYATQDVDDVRIVGWALHRRKGSGYTVWACHHEVIHLVARFASDEKRALAAIEAFTAATDAGKTLCSLSAWRRRASDAARGLLPHLRRTLIPVSPPSSTTGSDDPPY